MYELCTCVFKEKDGFNKAKSSMRSLFSSSLRHLVLVLSFLPAILRRLLHPPLSLSLLSSARFISDQRIDRASKRQAPKEEGGGAAPAESMAMRHRARSAPSSPLTPSSTTRHTGYLVSQTRILDVIYGYLVPDRAQEAQEMLFG
uniref:Uncharacterized protein n=1 Tax=Oryza sativa subsp. japonica TaxID=39947 RepID=Q7F1S3_ORYSJ|nr:hypothetical protein [Oryza sativa Japonica Group]BAC83124.1 hypothetical protein [Oryza sativa Japonica Group]